MPMVSKNVLLNAEFIPNPTINVLQAPAALFGLVWASSLRNSVPLFGTLDKEITTTISHVVVTVVLVMNIATNFALYKRFKPIWDNKAMVPLFAAFTFPSSSTANVLTWYSSM